MKTVFSIFLIILFTPLTSPASWTVGTVDNSGLAGKYTSITLDSSGEPHISYSSIGTVESGTSAGFTSISTDSLDNVHMSYGGIGYKYATNSSGDWVTEQMEGNQVIVTSTSLTVDSSDNVHISNFSAPTGGVSLNYTTDASGEWVTETVDDTGLVLGPSFSSIAIDSGGTLHIGYSNNGNVRYAAKSLDVWSIEPVDSGQHVSLAVDSAGKGHISYYDSSNGFLKYATNASGSWFKETVDDTGDVGLYTSIAVDLSGNVHISYYDATSGNLKYATNASGSWVIETADSGGDVGQFASLAVDLTCTVHVSFYDDINRYLKYASRISYISFTDVLPGFWAHEYISAIACAGISTGYDDGTYKPLREVNRAQMAIFIIRALYSDDFIYSSTPYFPDVPSGHWAFKYIQKMYEEGISTGYDDGTYKPLREVNRAQMAIFIIRALYRDDFSYSSIPYFPDVPSGHWAFKYIQKMYEEGIATGYDDGTYKPLREVNRAQMAIIIARGFLGMH
jgi:predicted DNA-binding antitoxin AbrB/MazE fold protein